MAGSLADIAERLMAEFDGRLRPDQVSAAVQEAAAELAATPPSAWDEMVERSARQRLLEQQ